MTQKEKIAALALFRSERIGPVGYAELIEEFKTAEAAYDHIKRASKFRVCPLADAERELAKAEELGMMALFAGTPEYPALLSHARGCPPVIYAKGNLAALKKTAVAMVGSRNASLNAQTLAKDFARELALEGYAIVSGMARGIDTAAHEGALKSGRDAATIAVLAGGADNIYPLSNKGIYEVMAKNHLIISEMPPGSQPQQSLFPRRNNTISGLSKGVVIIEASLKSGSLITARFAAAQGRDVMAVPGFPMDDRSHGTNKLIKDGAALVESARDIIEIVGRASLLAKPSVKQAKFELNDAARQYVQTNMPKLKNRILSLLGAGEVGINELMRALPDTPAPAIANAIIELELDDRAAYSASGNLTAIL